MLGINMRNILSCASENIIRYQWNGLRNCIMELVWIGTIKKNVTLSMPGYVEGVMHEYQHKRPTIPHHAPHTW